VRRNPFEHFVHRRDAHSASELAIGTEYHTVERENVVFDSRRLSQHVFADSGSRKTRIASESSITVW
jgi:hypothetical protein